MRICSLLPGATEVVAALGRAGDLVGISHECDYPPEVRRVPAMVRPVVNPEGPSSVIDREVRTALANDRRLYDLDEPLFREAQPNLIITQDLCHVCAVTPDQLHRAIALLPHPPAMLSLNATTLEQVFKDVERIGTAIGKDGEARTLTVSLRSRVGTIRVRAAEAPTRPRVACLEWLEPLFAAGHWIPEMVAGAGGDDVLGTAGEPSKQITWEQLQAASPDILVCMPCGFSAERTLREMSTVTADPRWTRIPAVRSGRVYAVDAVSYFSRPGPRLVEGLSILATLFHPSIFGEATPPGARQVRVETKA
jgi:iron complex transport system substrate-binding protein